MKKTLFVALLVFLVSIVGFFKIYGKDVAIELPGSEPIAAMRNISPDNTNNAGLSKNGTKLTGSLEFDTTISASVVGFEKAFEMRVIQAVDEYGVLISKNDKTPEDELKLYVLLKNCSRGFIPSSSNVLHPNHPQYEYFVLIEKACKPFFELLDKNPKQIRSTAEAWLESSADKGNPAAKLVSLDSYPSPPSFEDAQSLLLPALSEVNRDPALKDSVYFAILGHLRNNEEAFASAFNYDVSLDYSFDSDTNAWAYLWCSNSFECKVEQEYSSSIQFPRELEVIKSRAAELQNAIENEDWEVLRLSH